MSDICTWPHCGHTAKDQCKWEDQALRWQAHIEARSDDPDEITRLTADVKRLKGVQQKVYSALLDEREKVARLTAALERIREWSDAYPLDVFPEPDWKKSEAVLSAAGLSLSAISAANMRHVISGVGSIARAALEEKP